MSKPTKPYYELVDVAIVVLLLAFCATCIAVGLAYE